MVWAAWVFASVTLSVDVCVRAIKGKRLALTTPNLVNTYGRVSACMIAGDKVKGQGHWVIKCATGVGTQVITIILSLKKSAVSSISKASKKLEILLLAVCFFV